MRFDNNNPIYIQVVKKLKQDIVNGKLTTGDKIPSTRDFSTEISLNINTVARVYKHLEKEGIVETRRGLGTYIISTPEKIDEMRQEIANSLIEDFMKGMKDIGYGKSEIITMVNHNETGGTNNE